MTAQNFMNVVRFKLKSDCVDKYFEVIDKTSFEGMTQRYIAKTGDYDYCFVGIWKSAEAIAAQRPAMIAHLDEVRAFMEELSPEHGVTDPVSGMSAKSRGFDEKLLDGYTAEFVMPDVLVEESIKADSVLCY